MRKEMNITLDHEERILQKKMKDSFSPAEKDLWPAIEKAIAKNRAETVSVTRKHISRRIWVTAAALAAVLGLMGAGILKHWFVCDSNGSKTALAENEGFEPGNGFAGMKPYMDGMEEFYFPYDWMENENLIPGGLQIPGYTAEEQNIPELREMLEKLPGGTLVDLQTNGIGYTAIQGSFSTDYETCQKEALGNILGIRLPDASMIPADYNERPAFTIGYYVTDEDYAAKEELSSKMAERYTLHSYLLPETVQDQIGWYALQWFKADKKPITCTAYLAETDDMFISTLDETDIVRPLTIEGFDKALYCEQYNKVYEAQEISLILWEKINPITILNLGYSAAPAPESKQYIVYILDAVGITEEEALKIAEAW